MAVLFRFLFLLCFYQLLYITTNLVFSPSLTLSLSLIIHILCHIPLRHPSLDLLRPSFYSLTICSGHCVLFITCPV